MHNRRQHHTPPGSETSPAPPPPTLHTGSTAIVQCKGFRCLAYLDDQGKWRDHSDRRQLDVLKIVVQL